MRDSALATDQNRQVKTHKNRRTVYRIFTAKSKCCCKGVVSHSLVCQVGAEGVVSWRNESLI